MASSVAPEPSESTVELVTPEEQKSVWRGARVVGVFFWILVLILVVLIITRYI
jgi:hypothetical protein